MYSNEMIVVTVSNVVNIRSMVLLDTSRDEEQQDNCLSEKFIEFQGL